MSRFDQAIPRYGSESGFVRTATVFGSYFILLELGLHALYSAPLFEERGTERLFLVALLLATSAAVWLGRPSVQLIVDVVVGPVQRLGLHAVWAFVALSTILFIVVARWVLDAFPNSGDEIAYVMQGQTYAEWRLWADPPPLAEAFRQFRFFDIGDKWVSQYPPGWPMVLAPAIALGLPAWIVNPMIGAATLVVFFILARRYVSRESAWIGLLLLGTSSFFILNSSSYFSHSVAAFYGIVFALFGSRYLAKGEIWSALVVGACIGLMGLTRPLNAGIFAAPFAVSLMLTPGRRGGLFWFGLGGAPFLVALLAFNVVVHGGLLLTELNGPGAVGAGGALPLGAPTPDTIRMTWLHFVQLYSWTSPVLFFGVFVAFVAAFRQRRLDFLDWIMPTTIVSILFFNNDGGNQYGPRYYFEAWPFAILTMLKVIDPILFGVERGAPRSTWVSAALVASLLFEVGYLPVRLEREHRVIAEREDVYSQTERARLDNAIVIIASSVGIIRPLLPEDFIRNGLRVGEQRVIYALDLGARNASLRSHFPGRSLYVYSNGRLQPWL